MLLLRYQILALASTGTNQGLVQLRGEGRAIWQRLRSPGGSWRRTLPGELLRQEVSHARTRNPLDKFDLVN